MRGGSWVKIKYDISGIALNAVVSFSNFLVKHMGYTKEHEESRVCRVLITIASFPTLLLDKRMG